MKPLLSLLAVLTVLALQSNSAQAQNAKDWGTIKGKIIWNGAPVPPAGVIKLPAGNAAVPQCLQANNNQPPPNQAWVVNAKNKGIKNTFVWLVDADKKPLRIHPALQAIQVKKVEIDQPACHFVPHALALREGQILVVKNSAPFQHNFKYSGGPTTMNSGNFIVPPAGEVPLKLEADRLPIKVECNIHPWMNGWVRVFNHPYFAVTDADGSFEIKDAPAGNFRLMIWHGSAGWKDGAKGKNGDPVEIKGGAVTDLGSIKAFPTE